MTEKPIVMPDPDAFALGYLPASAQRFDGTVFADVKETVIEEVPVSLEWNGTRHIVMMATPTDLEAFAVGFSITEGIIDSANQILAVDVVPTASGVGILILIADELVSRIADRERLGGGNSSCGLCGIQDMQEATRMPRHVSGNQIFSPQAITRAMRELPQFQPIGTRTGAAHAAAFALPSGEIVQACEDAGRHNALDKLVGKLALQGTNPSDGFLALTSRASFEMVQKAAAAGFPMLCAISAPTGLAARMAHEAGITLVAFARDERFVCFAHPHRIVL